MHERLDITQINNYLDVSGAFDNCFFHTYALHLLANRIPLPADLFSFHSILGERSAASVLQTKFPNADALSLFAHFAQRYRRAAGAGLPDFIVEKTLVLGFLLREWFATQMATRPASGAAMHAHVIAKFKAYRDFRAFMSADDLLTGPEGVVYSANQAFLEYFVARPKAAAELTHQEDEFEQYFIAHGGSEEQALRAYWDAQGYLHYCRQIATPNTKLALDDVAPVLRQLGQSVTVYDERTSLSQNLPGNDTLPRLRVVLNPLEAHYKLLKTEATQGLLAEYQNSFDQYKRDRAEILASSGNKQNVADSLSSLFAAAICPPGQLEQDAFTLLLNKIDSLQRLIVAYDEEQEQIRQNHITDIFAKIDTVLHHLNDKIGGVKQHHSANAVSMAVQLLARLQQARNNYYQTIILPAANMRDAANHFKKECQEAIAEAKPVLERDLSWGNYLRNLWNQLLHAVASVFVSGTKNTFFTPMRSESLLAIEQAVTDLRFDNPGQVR